MKPKETALSWWHLSGEEKDALPRDDRKTGRCSMEVGLKTLRRWRLDNEGPIWHNLFHHVRYHEADIVEFERQSAQHLDDDSW